MSVHRRGIWVPTVVMLAFAASLNAADEPQAADRELHVVSIYEGVTKTDGKIHGGRAVVAVDARASV